VMVAAWRRRRMKIETEWEVVVRDIYGSRVVAGPFLDRENAELVAAQQASCSTDHSRWEIRRVKAGESGQ
ncbi:MAG: hypothetical protein ACRD2F_11030, partial [Terriglobales bacterium]